MSILGRSIDRPRRGVPLGLLGALGLILGFESLIERHPLDNLAGTQWSYKLAAQVATTEARKCQVLCFGDSLLKLGLAPRVVAAESGLRTYNLAIQGGQAAGSFFLLRRALEAGARPRAIVVDFFPSMLGTTPHFNDQNLPLALSLRDCVDLAGTLREPDEFARLTVARVLPSARSRGSIRSQVQFALAGSPLPIRAEMLRGLRNWRINRGAEITTPRPLMPDLDAWERSAFGSFGVLPANVRYLERFLELAAAHKIPVFWTLPPYRSGLQERCERSGFDAAHEAFVRPYLSRFPNLVVIDARRSSYDPDVFVDWHHLGRAGAVAFSGEVGRTIRERLCDPNSRLAWTPLPAYQPRPERVPLEDGEQSRLIVSREAQRTVGPWRRR